MIRFGGRGSVPLELQLDSVLLLIQASASHSVAGSVFSSDALLKLTPYSVARPAPQTGSYNMRLGADGGLPAAPDASGYAMISVRKVGAVRIAGRRADGTATSSGALMHSDGSLAWHSGLYAGGCRDTPGSSKISRFGGNIIGQIVLNPVGAAAGVTGSAEWSKPKLSRPVSGLQVVWQESS